MSEPDNPQGQDLDPQSLARKVAEHLRSSAPTSKRRGRRARHRRPFPTIGLLRGLGVTAIFLGVGFAAVAALPWLGGVFDRLTGSPTIEDPDPSFSEQLSPTASTSPTPENQPAVVAVSTTTAPPGTTTVTVPRPRRGGTPETTPSPTSPTTPPATTPPTLPSTTGGTPTTLPTTTTAPPPTTTTTTATTTPTTTTTTEEQEPQP